MAGIFSKHRFKIFNQNQHPLKHTLSDFGYSNESLPGISNIESALDWILAVLYPQTQAAVANPAALPLVGNTINDFRVVLDDGDGKAASYRWEQREGEGSPSWHKIYDMDFGVDSITEHYLNITQDLYVAQLGKQDRDASGAFVTGIYAGQKIWGGKIANDNLTFNANSFDSSGFVQSDNTFRPTADNTLDLGTNALRWRTGYFGTDVRIGATLILAPGSITDTSGAISFGDEDLSTTGTIAGTIGQFSSTVVVGTLGSTIAITGGFITSATGSINFDDENLITTGTLASGTHTISSDLILATGSITSASGAISFGNENLSTTGTLSAGDTTVTQLNSDNLRLDGNTLSSTNVDGNIIVVANGVGVVDIQSAMTTVGQTVTGIVSITGQLNIDNLRLDANVISAQNVNGNITLTPNGTGFVQTTSAINPSVDASFPLGTTLLRFTDLFLSGSIGDGTTVITQTTLQSLRDINVGVMAGFSLFWDGSKWVSSAPDTEIVHNTISGLTDGDAGHTQFAMLAGRSGGQTLQGGTGASENLSLESTAHATKGSVFTKDHFRPFTDASFSGSWLGTDLGGGSNQFRDLWMRGEAHGFRLENFTSGTLPAASAQNVGRLVYATDNSKLYVDTGTAFIVAGVSKFVEDTVWNGTDLTKDVTVSSTITDARNAIWALHDNTNDFDRIYTSIKAISATQVRITTSIALPAGSYRLIGLE